MRLGFRGHGQEFGRQRRGHLGGELGDEFLEEGGERVVGFGEGPLGIFEEVHEVVVGRRDSVDEVFEDEGELLDEHGGVGGEGEGAVVGGG